ncbi:hypothetical protein CASFOL_002160 [Castilleja foliolosa]|uniref:Uncharacterized protein n=1 Tax=Castilleja foliolosa TaxID=1961234 RepID=A0ABD3EH22_9LAMI
MGNNSADEMKNEVLQAVEIQDSENNQILKTELGQQTHQQQQHPYEFHVSGPRNVPSINWSDLKISSWKDSNYKRTVIACFIQAIYLLELDRQENRTNENALAPKWWTPFKYKVVETLIDERDGSIFGAILEWDRAAALADFVLLRPNGAPRSILCLRGTFRKGPTIRRDIEDDLRFLTLESLKGSIRFECALNALKSISEKYGSSNVCIAGHSLGAGFALQVGKTLAKDAIFVETHLFNPPSVSLASGFRTVSEKAGSVWKRFRAMMSKENENENETGAEGVRLGSKQWVPQSYVNNSDYICCYYNDPVENRAGSSGDDDGDKENAKPTGAHSGDGGVKLLEPLHSLPPTQQSPSNYRC